MTTERPFVSGDILETAAAYQPAAVLAAAADLDVFAALRPAPLRAEDLARNIDASVRGARILLDALVALDLLEKEGDRYSVPESIAPLLADRGRGSVLGMARHQANCLRRWAQLAHVVKTGRPAKRSPSVRGAEADRASFIEAMDDVSGPLADEIVGELEELPFRRLLDVGGASGTWTIAFLRMRPEATATLLELPEVIPLARKRLSEAGLADRVRLVPGDYVEDVLPPGHDLVWLSAVVHQNSRDQNRLLFRRSLEALVGGGAVVVRDIVMERSRVAPLRGALFAVNMLVGTEGGGTYTLDELREDLGSAGFEDARLLRRDEGMHSLIAARKPVR